jgi:hypothetical protein
MNSIAGKAMKSAYYTQLLRRSHGEWETPRPSFGSDFFRTAKPELLQ